MSLLDSVPREYHLIVIVVVRIRVADLFLEIIKICARNVLEAIHI